MSDFTTLWSYSAANCFEEDPLFLNRVISPFSRADAQGLIDSGHVDFTVIRHARMGFLLDRFHEFLNLIIRAYNLDPHGFRECLEGSSVGLLQVVAQAATAYALKMHSERIPRSLLRG